ncbi:hypothetical protein L249_8237 [Ophiocordyceps polyrhachis-furcata BCC 54312]|uniref:Autophagy-related protein 3 n=1 Tax=Ophiocordyceps polyrhachis-furcata BCC 54312 TaxID=1330021 RepID=A0A367LHE5_9HYPO|nr:hypothetical protein L249_8237 [Ophiocordyceps polyrhachis-furcata BCC 54312]
MNYIKSTVNTLRDRYTPVTHNSTFRQTGQITPEEFLAAGEYLVYKFPTWSWGDADDESRRVSYLPAGKQFLVTRNVPCHRRLDDDFAGDAGHEEALVHEGDDFRSGVGGGAASGRGDDDGWLRTGGLSSSQPLKARDVRTVDDSGNVADTTDIEDDDIPDMEEDDDDDEAIIRDVGSDSRSGRSMMEDIVGDYKDKTVTLEDFPFFANNVKMASVHPCKHASVMKTLLDRADASLRIRRDRLRAARSASSPQSAHNNDDNNKQAVDDLADDLDKLVVQSAQDAADKDGWEEVEGVDADEQEVAIRVDQYLVVFLKFMASVTPGIEHDFTMGV